ncbi:MAG: glycerol-3-phosphate ABC transporter ATP-binding protein, partial [Thermus sp.]|nr:glycerol-3-phosphate ABC transporter ATP-binding protein [Thermus sp.]
MAKVRLEHVWKRFGKVVAVKDFNLETEDGEFVVFVGPS